VNRKVKIGLIVIPIATAVAIILVVRWALSSPSLEVLITTDIGIGLATLGLLSSATLALFVAINGVKDSINETTRRIIQNSNESTRRMIKAMERINNESTRRIVENSDENARRIVEAIKG